MSLFPSFIRTVVPLAAGLLLTLAARANFDMDDGTATAAVTAALTAGYYAVFRLLEEGAGRLDVPWLRRLAGLALGWARPPQYPVPQQGLTVAPGPRPGP